MYVSNSVSERSQVTVDVLRKMKAEGRKITVLTAYDSTHAALLEQAGIDVTLVGDSLGMVVRGDRTTLSVSVDDMVYHTHCVAQATQSCLLIADMPFASAPDCFSAFENAARLVAEGGAQMVKLEGAGHMLECIEYLSQRDIPVCAHLGLTPQSVYRLGGYRVQGREQSAADALLADALAVEAAGASLLVLECVPAALAQKITQQLGIPTIGIGAGPDCDGQVLVIYDMLGMTSGKRPRFVKDFLSGSNSALDALKAYVSAVQKGEFPSAEHCFS